MKTKYMQLVGRIADHYYVLDYTFDNEDGFKGATGYIFVPVTKEQIKNALTYEAVKERFEELWIDAVHNRLTEQGLDAYINEIYNNISIDDMFDTSEFSTGVTVAQVYNSELPENTPDEKKAEFCECVGAGRIFLHNIKFDKVYNQELLDEINEFEERE